MAAIAVAGIPSGLERLLQQRGHDTLPVKSIEAALDLADDPPGLLVVGPAVDQGLELVARVRLSSSANALPILVLTADDEAAFLRAYAAGASDCLARTASDAVFLAKCTRLLQLGLEEACRRPTRLPRDGERVLERYQLEEVLGSGTFGAVYSAIDEVEQRPVALKLLRGGDRLEPDARNRFLREAYTLASVRSPNVVQVYDFGKKSGYLYCAMERVDGASLYGLVSGCGACPPDRIRPLLIGLTRALQALEERDLVHRDIKPANVMLRGGRFDQPVLVDFGLAKRPLDRSVTSPDVILGSPGYIAPEVLQGDPDHRSDLFSMGQVVLYAARGGEAFPDLVGYQLVSRMSQSPVPLPPELPADLRPLLRSLVALDPAARPPSATALLRQLEAPPSSDDRPTAPLRRPPARPSNLGEVETVDFARAPDEEPSG